MYIIYIYIYMYMCIYIYMGHIFVQSGNKTSNQSTASKDPTRFVLPRTPARIDVVDDPQITRELAVRQPPDRDEREDDEDHRIKQQPIS